MSFLFSNSGWTKRERLAILILSSFLFIFFLSDIFFDRLYPESDYSIPSDSLIFYQQLILELENDLTSTQETQRKESIISNNKENEPEKRIKLKDFDPNDLDLEGWMNLGFSNKQSQSLLNYKKSIGGFKNEDDLSRSFVVSEEKFKELRPYLNIEDQDIEKKNLFNEASSEIVEEIMIDLNSSDSISLLILNGIGPFYARKIIEYREALGGFVSKTQLLELWKFDSIKLHAISANVFIDTTYNRSLNFNSDSVSTFYKHPYIDWNTAKAIVNYRSQHGKFNSKNDLKKIVLINDSLFLKIYPYVSLK